MLDVISRLKVGPKIHFGDSATSQPITSAIILVEDGWAWPISVFLTFQPQQRKSLTIFQPWYCALSPAGGIFNQHSTTTTVIMQRIRSIQFDVICHNAI